MITATREPDGTYTVTIDGVMMATCAEKDLADCLVALWPYDPENRVQTEEEA